MVPFWDRERLCQEMRPFDFNQEVALSELEREYCAYYRIDKEAQIEGVSHRLGYLDSTHYRLALHTYTPPNPKGTVFVFHGYFDHVGLYGHLIEYLLKDSYAVVIYDLPGHGLSSGDPVAIKNFAEYRECLEACTALCEGHMPAPWFGVGQSTGGAVLIETLFKNRYTLENSPFEHWFLLAPLVRPKGWGQVVVLHSLLGGVLQKWRRGFAVNSNDSEFLKFLKEKDPLQSRFVSIEWVSALRKWVPHIESQAPLSMPVTVVQGQQDGTVAWRHNMMQLKRLLPDLNIHYLPKGRHQLVNEAPEMRNQVFHYIGEVLRKASQN